MAKRKDNVLTDSIDATIKTSNDTFENIKKNVIVVPLDSSATKAAINNEAKDAAEIFLKIDSGAKIIEKTLRESKDIGSAKFRQALHNNTVKNASAKLKAAVAKPADDRSEDEKGLVEKEAYILCQRLMEQVMFKNLIDGAEKAGGKIEVAGNSVDLRHPPGKTGARKSWSASAEGDSAGDVKFSAWPASKTAWTQVNHYVKDLTLHPLDVLCPNGDTQIEPWKVTQKWRDKNTGPSRKQLQKEIAKLKGSSATTPEQRVLEAIQTIISNVASVDVKNKNIAKKLIDLNKAVTDAQVKANS